MQKQTERSLLRGTFHGMFCYFRSVWCSLIQWGNKEGKKEPLFLAFFRFFFFQFWTFFGIYPHCVVVAFYMLFTNSEEVKYRLSYVMKVYYFTSF